MQKKLAFDIGCNVGNYTNKLLEKGWNVIAVDPNLFLFNNPPAGVTRVVSACSDSSGIIPFYFSNADTISTAAIEWVKDSRFTDKYSWQEYKVNSTTIDLLVEQYGCPGHIKIDVEGYELITLRGMTKKYSGEICFEWAEEQGDSAVECVRYLESLGYSRFGYIFGDDYLREPEKYIPIDEFLSEFKYDKDRKELWGMIWAK